MTEKFFEKKEEFDILAESALDAGLKAKLPSKGSVAYTRLYGLCKSYSDSVHRDMTGRGGNILGKERRGLHNDLCKVLFGTDYEHTPSQTIKEIANFSHIVAGREQYVW